MKTRVVELSKGFLCEPILDSISFELDSRELIALVGTNGAGKTTLLKTLATLYHPTSGDIFLDDQRLTRHRLDLRARLHLLGDQPVFAAQTAIDHICMCAHLYGVPLGGLKEQIIDWLRQFDLLEMAEKHIGSLSRGQRYKAAFIGLLAANPSLWLLDEPFAAGVDPTGLSAMKRMIAKTVGSGRTVIYSTQIVELAEQYSDRILILHQGKLAVDIPTREIRESGMPHSLERILENLRVAK